MNKKRSLAIQSIALLLTVNFVFAQNDTKTIRDTLGHQEKHKAAVNDEDNNRNVMLNAANNTSPRDVNIGLPTTVGGITVLENDLPVVYFFWPELPNRTWRQSSGLERTGLLKMDQLAVTMGDLGFAVNSYTQAGTDDLKLKGKLTTSNFGWLQGDINISGPISEKGWSYSAGIFANYDPSTYKPGFTRYSDQTNIYRVGITKKFQEDRGKISIHYKYADSYSFNNFALFEYGPNGKATELDYFRIGRDSYMTRDGGARFKDVLSGNEYWATLNGNSNRIKSHNIDVFGNYLLENGWNFKYSTRFHFGNVNLMTVIPLSITHTGNSDDYRIAETGQIYHGNIGTQLAMHTPKTQTTNLAGRFSISKQLNSHFVNIGLLEQYFRVNKFTSNRSFYYQTVENQPQRLSGPNGDESGFFNYNVGAEYHDGAENKLSLYASDDWKVTDNLTFNIGVHIRNHIVNGSFSMTPRHPGFVFEKDDFTNINHNWVQLGGNFGFTYNIKKNFGLLGNFLYTEENRRLESYSQAFDPNTKKSKSPLGAVGIFFNNDWIQLISQATYLHKNNYLNRYNLVNPESVTDVQNVTVYYDIQTLGWTTDFVLSPFKGFKLHYLLTLQNPVYKNFKFEAFGKSYDYSNNNVLGISKTLMEIDPSFTIRKWRIWASFRYFSEQYANLTNALYFAPRWETFGGASYDLNKNINMGVTVINFLNQRGASGTINGAELITDASQYYGRMLTGSYIMPLTAQLSVNFNF